MLNSMQIADKKGIYLLIHQPLSIFNSNAYTIQVDIGFFKKILANTTTLKQTVTKVTIILEYINLVRDNPNNNDL